MEIDADIALEMDYTPYEESCLNSNIAEGEPSGVEGNAAMTGIMPLDPAWQFCAGRTHRPIESDGSRLEMHTSTTKNRKIYFARKPPGIVGAFPAASAPQ